MVPRHRFINATSGPLALEQYDSVLARGRQADDFHVRLAREDQGNALPDDPVIVDAAHPDPPFGRHLSTTLHNWDDVFVLYSAGR
jgi:hypothetical protein